MLGVNLSLRNHYKELCKKDWQMQREADIEHNGNPVCTIRTKQKTHAMAPYLDNRFTESLQTDIPVLSKQVRYRNQYGKLILSQDLYFIFIAGTVTINKDDIIEHSGAKYTVDSINNDLNSGFLQIEGILVS
jgi:hypothetical protein